jgi:hypothetical protein
MKIAFKLSTPEAVEYANAHGARMYGMDNNYFHLPSFVEWGDARIPRYTSIALERGYTDVTPNFLEDYYRPWKDKLASVQNREVNVVATLGSGSGFTDEQLAEIIWLGFKSALNAARMYPESKHTFSDHKEYLMGEAKKLLTPKQ